MMPQTQIAWNDATQHPVLDGGSWALLNQLRFVSMACRVKPQTDLFEACALLHGTDVGGRDAHAEALMRCLNQALGKPARLHSPGVQELTFDETWLVQLCTACAQGDDSSLIFLLNSRVRKEHRRLIRFLVTQISEYFSLN